MLNDILVICYLSSIIDRLYYLNFVLILSYVYGNIMNECNLFYLEKYERIWMYIVCMYVNNVCSCWKYCNF